MKWLYRLSLNEHFLQGFFYFLFLFWGQGENTPGTTHLPPRNLVKKVQVKSGEIPVLKNLRKIIWNVDSRSLTPKSAKSTCHPILKIINTEKDLKISKSKFNRYGGQVGSRTSGKNILTVWIVVQFDMGELGCATSLFQHLGSLKFSDKYDVGPAIWPHVNGYIDACK